MKPRNPLLRTKERDIARAGKLLFGAFFGEGATIEEGLARALAEEDGGEPTSADAEARAARTPAATHLAPSYTTIRCVHCTREAVLPSRTPTSALEAMGWRPVRCIDGSTAWRCDACGERAGTR